MSPSMLSRSLIAALALSMAPSGLALARPAAAKSARKGAVSPELLAAREKAALVYPDLAAHASPLIRRVVFEGQLDLDEASRLAALERGLEDADWPIRQRALGLALGHKDKALKEKAEKLLAQLFESPEEKERAVAYALLSEHIAPKQQAAWVQRAAKEGKPTARTAARAWLIASSPKVAWGLIEQGLAEPPAEPEHKQALEVLQTFNDPIAMKWATANSEAGGEIGDLARAYLIRLKDPKATRGYDAQLLKQFEQAKGDFSKRVYLAVLLAGRGQVEAAQRTLVTAIKFRDPKLRELAWRAIQPVRDVALLAQVRERILSDEDEPEQADLAFEWLVNWASAQAEPKVYELLQEGARSDRRPVRMRALKALTALKHRPSVALFESAMSEGQQEIRLAAAQGLAAVAEAGDEARLAEFLRKEPTAPVKVALIEALAAIGTPAVLDALQFVMMAPQPEVKRAAAVAVASTKQAKAAQLLQLLKQDPDIDLRFLVWQSLLQLEPAQMEREFKIALNWLRAEDAEALAQDPKISLDLLELMAREGGDDLKMIAVEGLHKRGAAAATTLLGLVELPDASLAAGALKALADLRKEASVATYRKGLEHKEGPVRAAAFEAIGLYGPWALLETCMEGTGDKDPLARAQAMLAAQRIAQRGE